VLARERFKPSLAARVIKSRFTDRWSAKIFDRRMVGVISDTICCSEETSVCSFSFIRTSIYTGVYSLILCIAKNRRAYSSSSFFREGGDDFAFGAVHVSSIYSDISFFSFSNLLFSKSSLILFIVLFVNIAPDNTGSYFISMEIGLSVSHPLFDWLYP